MRADIYRRGTAWPVDEAASLKTIDGRAISSGIRIDSSHSSNDVPVRRVLRYRCKDGDAAPAHQCVKTLPLRDGPLTLS
jgi:hypothetical protein